MRLGRRRLGIGRVALWAALALPALAIAGRWLLTPVAEARTTRRYHEGSFVLETTHETETGVVRVTDLMPLGDGRADIVRRIGVPEVEEHMMAAVERELSVTMGAYA